MYALISQENEVITYPLSLNQWRLDHPSVSLPETPTSQQLAEFNIVEVETSTMPAMQHIYNYEETAALDEDGVWRQAWNVSDASENEINARTSTQKVEMRRLRNQKLSETDWTQLSDAPVDAVAWSNYRAALRDVPSQGGFPWAINWPVPPAS